MIFTAVTIHLQQTSICDYCDKLWRVVSNCDKCWWMLTIYDKVWHFLTFSDIFWHFMSLRSDVLWHFVTVNGFRPLIFVTFCHILSHVVTHCHTLSRFDTRYQTLSQVITSRQNSLTFCQIEHFLFRKRINIFFYKFIL